MLSKKDTLGAICIIIIFSACVAVLTKLVLEAWIFVLWCFVNYVAHKFFFYDFQQCLDKAMMLRNQVKHNWDKGVFSFVWGEIKNSTSANLVNEDRKLRYLWPKACQQRAAFVFFSTCIYSLYSTSINAAAVMLVVIGFGYLTKPEFNSLVINSNDRIDVLYFDYFVASGAIVLSGIEKNNYYIGIFQRWYLILKITEENSERTSSNKAGTPIETNKIMNKHVEMKRNMKNEDKTSKSIANRALLLLK